MSAEDAAAQCACCRTALGESLHCSDCDVSFSSDTCIVCGSQAVGRHYGFWTATIGNSSESDSIEWEGVVTRKRFRVNPEYKREGHICNDCLADNGGCLPVAAYVLAAGFALFSVLLAITLLKAGKYANALICLVMFGGVLGGGCVFLGRYGKKAATSPSIGELTLRGERMVQSVMTEGEDREVYFYNFDSEYQRNGKFTQVGWQEIS